MLPQVEVPCALPLLLSGLRCATLQVIATATIAASVSLGGLGRYLIDGLAPRATTPEMAGGAILVAVLALVLDGVLALVQRWVVSPGITGRPGVGGAGRIPGSVAVEADRPPADATLCSPDRSARPGRDRTPDQHTIEGTAMKRTPSAAALLSPPRSSG